MHDKRRFHPIPAVLHENFAAFSEILLSDDDFPSTIGGWHALFNRWGDELEKEGKEALGVIVRPTGFKRYLEEHGIRAPDLSHLTAYALHLMRQGPPTPKG